MISAEATITQCLRHSNITEVILIGYTKREKEIKTDRHKDRDTQKQRETQTHRQTRSPTEKRTHGGGQDLIIGGNYVAAVTDLTEQTLEDDRRTKKDSVVNKPTTSVSQLQRSKL